MITSEDLICILEEMKDTQRRAARRLEEYTILMHRGEGAIALLTDLIKRCDERRRADEAKNEVDAEHIARPDKAKSPEDAEHSARAG